MGPRVKNVAVKNDFTLLIEFNNSEFKIFDMTSFLDKGVFKELKDVDYFRKVKPFLGSIAWPHGQDLCPDTLYICGTKKQRKQKLV